jgi:hypothetical protein
MFLYCEKVSTFILVGIPHEYSGCVDVLLSGYKIQCRVPLRNEVEICMIVNTSVEGC